MTADCILVFGVSGVGKTTACLDYVSRHPETLFVSASSLLRMRMDLSSEALRTAKRSEILSHQYELATALDSFRYGREMQPVLIDAHGVIDNDEMLIVLPVEAVASLQPSRFILLEASPDDIILRRAKGNRPRPRRSVNAIAAELAAERKAVMGYSKALGIEVAIADVTLGFRLDTVVENPTCPPAV